MAETAYKKPIGIDSDESLRALGVAEIESVGEENVYIVKGDQEYYFKTGSTEKYQVGTFDFSNAQEFGDALSASSAQVITLSRIRGTIAKERGIDPLPEINYDFDARPDLDFTKPAAAAEKGDLDFTHLNDLDFTKQRDLDFTGLHEPEPGYQPTIDPAMRVKLSSVDFGKIIAEARAQETENAKERFSLTAENFEELVGVYKAQKQEEEEPGIKAQGDLAIGVMLHNPKMIIDALNDGAKLNDFERDVSPPLHSMALFRDHEMIDLFVKHGAMVDGRDRNGDTALHVAAQEGAVDCAATLIKHGADINALNDYGTTPLMFSCIEGRAKTALFLIKEGADLNAIQPETGITALHCAAEKGRADIVQELIDAGAEIDAPALDGKTPLAVAAENGKIETVRRLLTAGADPDPIATQEGAIAILTAVNSRDPETLKRQECLRCIASAHEFKELDRSLAQAPALARAAEAAASLAEGLGNTAESAAQAALGAEPAPAPRRMARSI